MDKVGRNDPCPCGSGKKYKRCCLAKDEAQASVRATEYEARPKAVLPDWSSGDWSDDGLVEASNRVVDLINAGKLDEAEQSARKLLVDFPEVIDGYERLGMVYEARGDNKQAAGYYRQALAFIDKDPEGFGLRGLLPARRIIILCYRRTCAGRTYQ